MADNADQLTKKPHVQDGLGTKPKATYGPSSGPTGDDYVDRGAVCDQHAGPGCLLTKDQRQRLVMKFADRVNQTASNYNHGLADVKLDVVMEKEEDLSWVAVMLLDVATGYAAAALTSALTALKKNAASQLAEVAAEETLHQVEGAPRTLDQRLQVAFSSVSDAKLKDQVKKATDSTKKKVTAAAKHPQATKSKKKESLVFLQELQSAASAGFQQIRERVPMTADDAELIVATQAFDTDNHQASMYTEAIRAKLDRYLESGVSKIGISYEDRSITEDVPQGGEVIRDVRVAWLDFESGYPRRLAFQHQDGHRTYGVIHKDDPDAPPELHESRGFGPRDPITDKPEPGLSERSGTNYFVPDEFVDAAIERHKQVWGGEPPVVHVDDSSWTWEPARAKAAQRRKAAKLPKPKLPPAPAPITVPDALKLKPPGGGP